MPRSSADSLEHFGVKGMKWGQRKAEGGGGGGIGGAIRNYRHAPDSSGVSRSQARRQVKLQNRQTNRTIEDFEQSPNRSSMIRSARNNRVAAKRRYEDVKSEIKDQKSTGALGRNAARVVLNRARNERYENAYKANAKTMGEQFVEALFEPRVRTL